MFSLQSSGNLPHGVTDRDCDGPQQEERTADEKWERMSECEQQAILLEFHMQEHCEIDEELFGVPRLQNQSEQQWAAQRFMAVTAMWRKFRDNALKNI